MNPVTGIDMSAFFDELTKISASSGENRSPISTWTPKTVEAPRSKMTATETPKPPTPPGSMAPKLVRPAAQFGQRQNAQDTSDQNAPDSNPALNADLRMQPPPNVPFGVR